ncbi:hypothetical protein NSK_008109 [Nannochloropsis salina CCMP1776]|uniref:Uncharacterized protein n=1 Tax=Nannochloropsis salina CCMP1776 TaxID=1027361 RepID=A0A4D9CSK1_9STRA|nr:hypothetical protein NSK_008109 [Nannochloropsis salina CCMP1776]|eukprot:TFJ80533.1 hypothetical protein NSK_008109 [Nannochloropsis salina CCMP1776]
MRHILSLFLAPTLMVTGFLLPRLPQYHTTSRAASSLRMVLPSAKEGKGKVTSFYPFETSLGVKGKKDNSEVGTDAARQLLGMKGAAETDDLLKIRVQLMKPVTWIPLIWGVVCGAAASGNYHWANPFDQGSPDAVPLPLGLEDAAKAVTCMPSLPCQVFPLARIETSNYTYRE